MSARVEPLPGFASVARAHDHSVLPAQITVFSIGHLDAKNRQVAADFDALEMQSAIFGKQQLSSCSTDKCASRAGRPDVEKVVAEGNVSLGKRRNPNLAMTRGDCERCDCEDYFCPSGRGFFLRHEAVRGNNSGV